MGKEEGGGEVKKLCDFCSFFFLFLFLFMFFFPFCKYRNLGATRAQAVLQDR